MKRRIGLLVTMLTLSALVIGAVGVTSVGATKKGSEGCTPGYWKNHTDSWVGYASTDLFSSVFEDAFSGKTLLTVLTQPASTGGTNALNNLGRHTVAALLNASSSVDYPYSTATVIGLFNAAYQGSDGAYEALKNIFAGFNELGCPLN